MSHPHKVVIVGGGQAGCQLASALREVGYAGQIVLLCQESHYPYQRPPLSKTAIGAPPALYLRNDQYFRRKDIDVRLGQWALAIDRKARKVFAGDGSLVEYDHLVLATGSTVRPLNTPGANHPSVKYLRTIEDAVALERHLERSEHLIIVGAGFIGLEYAARATRIGKCVTIIDTEQRPLARHVSGHISDWLAAFHSGAGVEFRFGVHVRQLHHRSDGGLGVELANAERLNADYVLAGVGTTPNIELATAAGLDCGNGIRVDETLLSSDRNISAIGDCASFPFPKYGYVRLESVQNAIDQARHVARRLAGQAASYSALPWFWSDQGAVKLQIAGLAFEDCKTLVSPDASQAGLTAYRIKEGLLTCVETINRPNDHALARRVLQQAPTQRQLVEARFDLRALLSVPAKTQGLAS